MIDEEITAVEEYLKHFHPRAAGALDLARRRRKRGLALALGSAAALLVVVLLSIRATQSPPSTVNNTTGGLMTVGRLNAAARSDESLDLILDEWAKRSLPRTTAPNTALNALSKE